MKRCSYCGAQNEDENLFCTECGKELPKGFVCPSCGTNLDAGDIFCSNCGKRIEEQSELDIIQALQKRCANCGTLLEEDDICCPNCGEKNDLEPPLLSSNNIDISNDETDIENTRKDSIPVSVDNENNSLSDNINKEGGGGDDNIMVEKAKTLNLRKLSTVVAGLFFLAAIGYGYWNGFNTLSGNQQAVNQESSNLKYEQSRNDYLEKARLDSINKAKQEEERIETESKEFCKRFSLEDLLCLLKNYKNPDKAESSGLTFIYKDVTKEKYGDDMTIVYGKYIERDDNNQIKSTTTHSCYFQVLLNTSTQYRMNFSNMDDASSFFKKVKDSGVINYRKKYYIPKKMLPGGKTITLPAINWSSDYAPIYCIEPPMIIDGFYSIIIGSVSNSYAPEAVDLGLSVKWATMNIGAIDIYDVGEYFAWGETESKGEFDFDLEHYFDVKEIKHGWMAFMKMFKRNGYNSIKGNKSYDVAAKRLGGYWRMPTPYECKELARKCTLQLIYDKERELHYWEVIGKNGNKIILPNTGYMGLNGHSGNRYGVYFWTTEIDMNDDTKAYSAQFSNGFIDAPWAVQPEHRDMGLTVRPIYDELSRLIKSTNPIERKWGEVLKYIKSASEAGFSNARYENLNYAVELLKELERTPGVENVVELEKIRKHRNTIEKYLSKLEDY